MGEGRERDHIEDIEGQMQAAGALVESLEEEVASLRRDLEQASVALRAAQEEVSARESALEAKEQARQDSETEARKLSENLTELRIKNSDEQLLLANQHISELSRLQGRFHSQLWARIEAALSTDDAEALKSEYGKVREAMDQDYWERIGPLESSYREARDLLRETERELDGRRSREIEELRRETEERLRDQEEQLRQQFDERLAYELEKANRDHEEEMNALRKVVAELEQEIRREYETQRAASEADREDLENRLAEAEERYREELHKIKSLAENREQELRKTHAARLSEAKAEADRRVEALQAQREADDRALRDQHEERPAGEIEFDSPADAEDASGHTIPWETALLLQERVDDLEKSLSESERAREVLSEKLESLQNSEQTEPKDPTKEEARQRPNERDAEASQREERVRELEARLADAREEERHRTEELERATNSLRQLLEPEHRLRNGIAEFNASEHARHVASISKSLGLPKVHAGISGEDPGKPVFTFVWEDLAWRRYAAAPVEGVEGPSVYLVGSGDESGDLPDSQEEFNARIDSRGRLILGIQAR